MSDLCARLEKLKINLATFSIFAQEPLKQSPKLMVTAALLFIKPKKKPMNAKDFKAALTIISTSKEEDCNAVATLYQKMSQGLYPTQKEREAAKVAIDNLLALQAVQNKDNAKQMLENLKNVKMFISSLPEKDDAQLVRDAYGED